jgi:hypothetical protein
VADSKISALADGAAPQVTDQFVVARGGGNNKLSWAELLAAFQTAGAPDQLAVSLGYKGYSWNPLTSAVAASALGSGLVELSGLWLPPGTLCTNVVFCAQAAAAGTAPTGFFVGLAGPTGTMVAQSGNLASAGGPLAVGPVPMALTATYTTNASDSPSGFYYAVVLQNGAWGTTQPSFIAGAVNPVAASAKLGSNPPPGGSGATGAQTALPANGSGIVGGISTAANLKSYWAGVS